MGEDYLAIGTIAETTAKAFLMYDSTGYIFVYLDTVHNYESGDVVEVEGPTSEFGGAVQFASTVTVTKTGTAIVTDPGNATVLIGSQVDTYFNSFEVGDYVEVTGTLSISGDYLNLNIEGSNKTGSIQSDGSIDFSTYNGEEITIRGYTLYFSGSTNTYFNILVTEVSEVVESNTFDLTILEVNDLHGYIEQEDDGTGGISNMAYLIDQIRNQNTLDDVILIANGDMFQGTAISNMTEGLSVIECMNMMGFDVMGIGNHEFDWEINTLLTYFDGIEANGEADFPLLNANIYLLADDSLLAISGGNIFEYTIIEREGIDIGIISYIGDIYGSISGELTADYYFDTNISNSVQTIATDLRTAGADVIIVNIHGGDAYNIESYIYNVQLAQLTDTNGKYLVDVVINGHTHSYQTGAITRSNGSPMVVIQAGGKGNAFGEIVLTIDLNNMSITDYSVDLVYTDEAGTNCDIVIETYLDDLANSLDNNILVTSGETVNYSSDLYDWINNVALAATGADIVFNNTGGIRSNGNIIADQGITVGQVYEIFPFDNTLFVMEMTYEEMVYLLNNSVIFYNLAEGVILQSGETYTVALNSFIYYWDQIQAIKSSSDLNTELLLRDLLIEDLTIKGENSQIFYPITNPVASVTMQIIYPIPVSYYGDLIIEERNYLYV